MFLFFLHQVARFRTGRTSVLLVTDVAARGIDIPLLDNVVNFNFPAKPKLFVHRVGQCRWAQFDSERRVPLRSLWVEFDFARRPQNAVFS